MTGSSIPAGGDLTVADDLVVSDDVAVTGLMTVGETLGVTGATTLSSTLGVTGAATFSSTVDLADDMALRFGAGPDATILYDETTDDVLEFNAANGIWFNGLGGAKAANMLFFGAGTSGSPATTATANKSFIEFRTESTATSGDSRALYLRHSLNGAGVNGEAIRAFSKIDAGAATARGAHISLDVASAGSCSGLGVGVDNQILAHNGALAGGTYAVGNFEIYSAGSSTDVSGVTEISFMRVVAGGDATGIANVDDNAFLMSFSGIAAGAGNIIDTNITTHTAYAGLKVNIPGVGTRWIALVSA